MSIEKILFPTKFRELSFDSLESILPLKDAGLKEVVLFNVILREEVGFVPFGGYLKGEEEKKREEARVRFDDWQTSLSEKGIASRVLIHVGEPVHEILVLAEEEKVDLVVVGRKKRVGIEESFFGSYTDKIITRSKLPVLVSKYMVQYNWDEAELTKKNDRPFDLPMVVVDWSELSQRVIDFLISMSGAVRKAFLFHNINVKEMKDRSEAAISQVEKEGHEKLNAYCEKLRSAGIDAEAHIGAGGMLDEIIRVSRERKASMIVMGNTSEERSLLRMLHKSLSYQVARSSELPTLLVR